MKTVGIFGGSFNPVHIGHLMLANYLCEFTRLDEVWLTLSPLNPLKSSSTELIADSYRLEMLNIATKDSSRIGVCDVELTMPRPSYTINTLDRLQELHPDTAFKLIIGSDNWVIFDRWKENRQILDRFGVMVYPRPGYKLADRPDTENAEFVNAPEIDLSSTFIRNAIADGKDMNYFMPEGVYNYIKEKKLYI